LIRAVQRRQLIPLLNRHTPALAAVDDRDTVDSRLAIKR
jgi:hypothetical protein